MIAPHNLPPERRGFPAPVELLALRQGLSAAVASGIWQTEPLPETLYYGGVRCLSFAPLGSNGTILHLHGGGFRLGCPEQSGPFAAALAARCGVRVVCPAYRLAPEHPFPAGLIDAWSVMTGIFAAGETRLIISGDSAGGALAAGLASMLDKRSPRALGLALLSPWLDLTVTAASYASNGATDPLFSEVSAQGAAALYLQGTAPGHPRASPLAGPIDAFPPTFINAGTGEVLVNDAVGMHRKLGEAGISSRLQLVEGMDHVAVTRGLELPGSNDTFHALADFVDEILEGASD